MKKKLIPLALTGILCFGLLAGCQSSELSSYSEDAAEESAAAEAAEKDYTPCYKAYDADKVMLTVNGIEVTWGELFYWYQYDVSNIENTYGDITDWDAESSFSEGKTNREYVMENAIDTVLHYCALESKAKDMGVALSEEDEAELQTIWENNVKNYGNGDEATFIEYLNKAFLSRELYEHINEVSMLYELTLEKMFGAQGEKLSEEEVQQKASDMGYLRVKHILISTQDDTGAALPDAQKAEKKALADKLLKELQGISDNTKLETRFDALIAEHGEDPGTAYYTDGYTFISGGGTMDTAFDAAATALGEYKLSLVETSYGYHIVMRLPLKSSAAVEYTSETEMTPLAYYVAQEMFSAETDNWAEESTVEYSKTYNKMDIAKVFSKAKGTATKG